jgi:hypothetical protein
LLCVLFVQVSEFSIYWNLALHNNSVDLQYHNGRRQPHWMAGVDVTVPEADLTPDDRLQSLAAESEPEWPTLPTKEEMDMLDRMLEEPEGEEEDDPRMGGQWRKTPR